MAPPIMTQTSDAQALAVFPVPLIFYLEDQRLRDSISPSSIQFDGERNVQGHGEVFRFSIENVTTEEDLNFALRRILLRDKSNSFVIVSDKLTAAEAEGKGKVRPGPLAESIRSQFRDSRHLCGLLGIDSRPVGRVHDIDRVISPSVDESALRKAIAAVATGLRLKSLPPVRASRAAAAGVKIQVVQSVGELRQCLALRKESMDFWVICRAMSWTIPRAWNWTGTTAAPSTSPLFAATRLSARSVSCSNSPQSRRQPVVPAASPIVRSSPGMITGDGAARSLASRDPRFADATTTWPSCPYRFSNRPSSTAAGATSCEKRHRAPN